MANLADQTSGQMRSDAQDPDVGSDTRCHTHCGSSIDTRSDTSKIETYIEEEGGHVPDGDGTGLESQLAPNDDDTTPRDRSPPRWRRYLEKSRAVAPLAAWILVTGWWICGLVLHREDLGWVVPFLVWLAASCRVLTWHVPTRYMTEPARYMWTACVQRPLTSVPAGWRLPLSGLCTAALIVAFTFEQPDSPGNTRQDRAVSLFGFIVFLSGFWATSADRKRINYQTVIVGVLVQYLLGLVVLRTQTGTYVFTFLASLAKTLLGYSEDGTIFLTDSDVPTLGWFLVLVVPPIIFFVALIQLLSYWGLVQWGVKKFAVFFLHAMQVSGAEAVVAVACPFLGNIEAQMLIKNYIPILTKAELHQIMTSGFSTIASSVLYAYMGMGISPSVLTSSCAMSIPASLVISKLRFPECEETLTAGTVTIPHDEDDEAQNALDAFAKGSWLGIKVAGMIVSGVMCIMGVLSLVNGLLGWWGQYINIRDPDLSMELVLGYLFYPVAFLMGVQRDGDLLRVAQLIGIKVVANEFVAYDHLTHDAAYAGLAPRSRLIVAYALCGFGNIASLGIQVGVLSQLAPSRRGEVSKMAFSALVSGVVATLTSACIAGMLMSDESP